MTIMKPVHRIVNLDAFAAFGFSVPVHAIMIFEKQSSHKPCFVSLFLNRSIHHIRIPAILYDKP